MKVVRMLQDMEAELQKGLDDDKEVHEQLECWCKTNNEEKTAAIQNGEAKLEQLESTMDAATAKLVQSKAQRKTTQEEQYQNEKALDEAEAMRMKENKAFHAEETDLLEAIDACKQSIVVLGAHHAPGLSQMQAVARQMTQARITDMAVRSGGLQHIQLELLKQFMGHADGGASFLSVPGFQSYAPQSGQIFGILKQLKRDFEDSLSDSQKKEKASQEEFEAMREAKEGEIATAKKAILGLDATIASFNEKHAAAAQEYEDTQAQLDMDKTFLTTLTQKCAATGEEFDARVKSRTEEIAAVQETIKILNSDEAFDVFDRSVKGVSLFQGAATTAEGAEAQRRRDRAVAVLRKAAAGTGEASLIMLAASAQIDAFTKVKEDIDKLVGELGQQQKDEVEQRDWCNYELASNQRDTAAGDDKKVDVQQKIADLEKTKAQLTDDRAAAQKAVAEMEKQMKEASETREAENAEYQQTVADQRITQMILIKALDRMRQVYGELLQQQPGAPHIATSGTHTDPGNGPARFTKYGQNAGGQRVVAALETVIADSRKMDDEAVRSEEDAQSAYESFMKALNKSLTVYNKSINDMSASLARTEEMLLASKQDFDQTMQMLEGLSNYLQDLHRSCDFVLNNFDARQEARAAEIQALRDAKSILSGMKA